jgi:hypothetical protein
VSIEGQDAVNFELEQPTIKSFAVNGKENQIISTSGSVSSGPFKASFSNVDIKVGGKGFVMSGLAKLSFSGKASHTEQVPFKAVIGGDASMNSIREPEKLARRAQSASRVTSEETVAEIEMEEDSILLQDSQAAHVPISVEIGPIAKMPSTQMLKKVLGVPPKLVDGMSAVAKDIKDAVIHFSSGDKTFKPGMTVVAKLKPSGDFVRDLKQVVTVSNKKYLTCALRPSSDGNLQIDVATPKGAIATLKHNKDLGAIRMEVEKLSATVSLEGFTAAVHGATKMGRGGLFDRPVRFAAATLNIKSGAYTLVTAAVPEPNGKLSSRKWKKFLKHLNKGINDKIHSGNFGHTLDGMADSKKRAIEAHVTETDKFEPGFMGTQMVVDHKNGKTRVAVRSEMPSAEEALTGQ